MIARIRNQAIKIPSMDCTFTCCKTQITNNDKVTCISFYNAHIATHTAMEVGGATSKNRAPPMERPEIEIGNLLADWEFLESGLQIPQD